MPDKLTDSEIVKALEYCINNDECSVACPCFNERIDMCGNYNGLLKQVLNLIKHQDAELEALTISNKNRLDAWLNAVAEKEKAEVKAYKEFAERLKRKKQYTYNYQMNIGTYCITTEDIDNLLKELVGEEK